MASDFVTASTAALAANAQGKFWEFHDQLFKNQQALDRPQLEEHAKKSGLDVTQFKKSLDEKKFGDQVEADMKLGEKVQVQGTPTMFLCGNNPDAKGTVSGMCAQFGWEPYDCGDIAASRALEPLCMLWCLPGFLHNEWRHAFKMLTK